MIEVTDLFERFGELAQIAWRDFEFRGPDSARLAREIGPSYGDLMDVLEHELFLAACARRLARREGSACSPAEIRELLRVHSRDNAPLPGRAVRYHSHGFDWGTPEDAEVGIQLVSGDLINRGLNEIRLFLADRIAGNGRVDGG